MTPLNCCSFLKKEIVDCFVYNYLTTNFGTQCYEDVPRDRLHHLRRCQGCAWQFPAWQAWLTLGFRVCAFRVRIKPEGSTLTPSPAIHMQTMIPEHQTSSTGNSLNPDHQTARSKPLPGQPQSREVELDSSLWYLGTKPSRHAFQRMFLMAWLPSCLLEIFRLRATGFHKVIVS